VQAHFAKKFKTKFGQAPKSDLDLWLKEEIPTEEVEADDDLI